MTIRKRAFLPFLFCGLIMFSWSAATTELNLPSALSDADFLPFTAEKALLGQMLFYDPLLSGNTNISCASCHHPTQGTSDNLPLGVGEGGAGLGTARNVGVGSDMIERRIPRNAQALFNLGAKEFSALFFDGRVSIDKQDPSGFDTPADEDTPLGLESLLAAQAIFPLTSEFEMAGQGGENPIGAALEDIYGNPWHQVWENVEKRLQQEPAYFPLFQAAYPKLSAPSDIQIDHYANAIADFMNSEWRTLNTPFDRYLRGQTDALGPLAVSGLELFYGKASCAECHSGTLQTDHDFHAIAVPQIGPGKVSRLEGLRHDRGRALATNLITDRYKFRTPPLRNIALTAPYGHSGVFATLEEVVRHHMDPKASFNAFTGQNIRLPSHPKLSAQDHYIMQDKRERRRILKANTLKQVKLSDNEVSALIAFLHSLTDANASKGRLGIPTRVPSGLPLQ